MYTHDSVGNKYMGNFETLFAACEGIETIQIKSSATSIYGVDQNHNAFYNCKETLKTVTFEENSQLLTIDNFSFYNCIYLTSIDLSKCTKLVSIGDESFSKCQALESAFLPNSLKELVAWCFWECKALKSITIPSSVTKIGVGTFGHCNKLEKITFEEGINLTTIESRTFEETNLLSFDLPPSVTKIEGTAFKATKSIKSITANGNSKYSVINGMLCTSDGKNVTYCPSSLNLITVNVPQDIINLQIYSFYYCQATEIVISNTVETIFDNAFGCSKLEKIVIPDTVKTLGRWAFYQCFSLSSVTLSNSLNALPFQTFYKVRVLKSITIPESVLKFGGSCFEGCTLLETINFPTNLNEIGDSCFAYCTNLGNIVLPANLQVFGGGAFSGCTKLSLKFADGSAFSIDDQFLITTNGGSSVAQYIGSEPDSKVTISSAVTTIEKAAFASNIYVKEVIFQENSQIKTIREEAFYHCDNLQIIQFPQSVTRIEKNAFALCPIKTISFDQNINYIGTYAFKQCKNLTKVYFTKPVTDLTIDEEAFSYCELLDEIQLPDGLIYLGNYFAFDTIALKRIVLPSSLKEVGGELFWKSSVETIVFNSDTVSLTTIGKQAFKRSFALKEFQFAEGIQNIDPGAFEDTLIFNVSLPKSIKKLGVDCFKNCVKLETIEVKDADSNLEIIEGGFANNCPMLRLFDCNNSHFVTNNGALYSADYSKIVLFPPASPAHFVCLPNDVRIIAPNTFYSCSNLISVLIPDDSLLTEIGAKSFANCTNLRTVNIPETVTLIGKDAFLDCKSMSCGLYISNTTLAFKEILINTGKMPRRCFDSCLIRHSLRRQISYFPFLFTQIVFML